MARFNQLLSPAILCVVPFFVSLGLLTSLSPVSAQPDQPHRAVILTDIEADPDDTQSLVRLLLYSNQIEIKGLVATTSCWLKADTHPESIQRIVRAYGQVQPTLSLHEEGFPTEEMLMNLITSGLPVYGMEGVGEGKDSEGSDLIIRLLKEDDERPLWISVWGGVNTLAQSLFRIRSTYSEAEAAHLISKLRVYTISDQDDSGIWIRNNFPDLFYIVSPGDHYARATWHGINAVIEGNDNTEISTQWIATNIQQGHGPLGVEYPDVSWGMEGDTPAFLSLIENGLNDAEHPDYGGWGGRYELFTPAFDPEWGGISGVPLEPETRPIWTDAPAQYTPYLEQAYGRSVRRADRTFDGNNTSLWRWRDDFQNDFAARMDWCLSAYGEANHPPVPALSHPQHLTFTSGESFTLDAFGSTDPDGDHISFLWFVYPEAGTYTGNFLLGQPENAHKVYGTAPVVEAPSTIHVILKVTDKGSPRLSRYQRIILTIEPS